MRAAQRRWLRRSGFVGSASVALVPSGMTVKVPPQCPVADIGTIYGVENAMTQVS
jgi:hypothetical protein